MPGPTRMYSDKHLVNFSHLHVIENRKRKVFFVFFLENLLFSLTVQVCTFYRLFTWYVHESSFSKSLF